MVDKKAVLEMRRNGASYPEIGRHFGVSWQYIQIVCDDGRVRKDSVNIERIAYKGLYEYFAEHERMTFTALARVMFGYSSHAARERAVRLCCGQEVTMKKSAIDRLIALTGKTYEQLFELREGFEEADD